MCATACVCVEVEGQLVGFNSFIPCAEPRDGTQTFKATLLLICYFSPSLSQFFLQNYYSHLSFNHHFLLVICFYSCFLDCNKCTTPKNIQWCLELIVSKNTFNHSIYLAKKINKEEKLMY